MEKQEDTDWFDSLFGEPEQEQPNKPESKKLKNSDNIVYRAKTARELITAIDRLFELRGQSKSGDFEGILDISEVKVLNAEITEMVNELDFFAWGFRLSMTEQELEYARVDFQLHGDEICHGEFHWTIEETLLEVKAKARSILRRSGDIDKQIKTPNGFDCKEGIIRFDGNGIGIPPDGCLHDILKILIENFGETVPHNKLDFDSNRQATDNLRNKIRKINDAFKNHGVPCTVSNSKGVGYRLEHTKSH